MKWIYANLFIKWVNYQIWIFPLDCRNIPAHKFYPGTLPIRSKAKFLFAVPLWQFAFSLSIFRTKLLKNINFSIFIHFRTHSIISISLLKPLAAKIWFPLLALDKTWRALMELIPSIFSIFFIVCPFLADISRSPDGHGSKSEDWPVLANDWQCWPIWNEEFIGLIWPLEMSKESMRPSKRPNAKI